MELSSLMALCFCCLQRPFKAQSPVLLQIFMDIFSFTSPEQLVDIPKISDVEQNLDPKEFAEMRAKEKKSLVQTVTKLPLPGPGRTVTRFGPSRQQFAGAVFMRRHRDHGNGVLVRHTPNTKELPPMSQAPNRRHAKAQKKDQKMTTQFDQAAISAQKTDSLSMINLSPKEIELRTKLRDLMINFLRESYTPLVGQVFKDARPGLDISRLGEDDFERFVRFVSFCTQFVRLGEEKRFKMKLRAGGDIAVTKDDADSNMVNSKDEASPFECISATMGWDCFHLVQVLFLLSVDREHERARDKDKPYRAHILLYSLGPLLREMLMTMDLARVSGNAADRQAADRLQRKLFHNDDRTGLLHVMSQLIREYKYHLHPRFHAVHLAEIFHIILAILDRLTSHGSYQVSKKVKKLKRRQKKPAHEKDGDAIKQGHAADGPEAAEGTSDPVAAPEADVEAGSDKKDKQEIVQHVEGEADDGDDDDMEEEEDYIVREQEFDAPKRLRSACAHSSMVQFYVWLLQGYQMNSDLTNLAIVSFLERLSSPQPKGMGLHCMLWQLSVIRTFHSVISDPKVHKTQKYRPLLRLCVFTIRGLFERLQPDLSQYEQKLEQISGEEFALRDELELLNLGVDGEGSDVESKKESVLAKLREVRVKTNEVKLEIKMKEECAALGFVEILFWKTSTTAESIAEEYNWRRYIEIQNSAEAQGEGQLGFASYKAKKKPGQFTEEQTEMLIEAFENCNGLKDCLSKLVFEFGGAFKKVHISRKLKELGLERGKMTEHQERMLNILAERHTEKDSKDRIETIQHELGGGFTTRQIKRNMRRLGLLAAKGKMPNEQQTHSDSSDGFGSSDEEEDQQTSPRSIPDAEKAFDDMLADLSPTREHTPASSVPHYDDSIMDPPPSPVAKPLSNPKEEERKSPGETKRKSPDEHRAEDDAAAADARRRALALLRAKYVPETNKGTTEGAISQPTSSIPPPALPSPPSSPRIESRENEETNNSPVKTFGRRLLKKKALSSMDDEESGRDAPHGQEGLFDGLEDY